MASSKKTSIIIKIITPIFIFAICAVIVAILAIKPYNKASMYLDIAFMDTLKTQANDGSVAGLTIKENEIIEDDSLSTSDTGEVIWPAFAEQYAVLKSDALELSIPVYWGISSEILEKGACQQSDSTILGNNGNTVISAHVNTFFSDLGKLNKVKTCIVLCALKCGNHRLCRSMGCAESERRHSCINDINACFDTLE